MKFGDVLFQYGGAVWCVVVPELGKVLSGRVMGEVSPSTVWYRLSDVWFRLGNVWQGALLLWSCRAAFSGVIVQLGRVVFCQVPLA